MAEEEVVAVAATQALSDHKRKLEDLETEELDPLTADLNSNGNSESGTAIKAEDGEDAAAAPANGDGGAESEAKRPRLEEDKPDFLAAENGHQEEAKVNEPDKENDAEQRVHVENNAQSEDAQELAKEDVEKVNNEPPAADDHHAGDAQQRSSDENSWLNNEPPAADDHHARDAQQQSSDENPQSENVEEQLSSKEEVQEPSVDVPLQGDTASVEQQPSAQTEMSRCMEVPNNKVGVLIGKGGDNIRYLQYNSGAKIQITRDAVADPSSVTRPVELIGTLENINKAEKLIKDVIAEADAGGSPALVARGFNTVQGAGEQIQISVPNEKVGLIIGKSGETIKSLQTRSGARIQVIQHLPEGDQSNERIVRITGDRKQIEVAREMIKEVMNQPVRPPPHSSGYNQQGFHPRGPAATQWGPRGSHRTQPMGYEYQQRGPYPSQNTQYPPQAYGNYPQQQPPPRSSFGPGWEQRPPATMQGPPQRAGAYDYYGGQGHIANVSASGPLSNAVHTHAPGPSPTPVMGQPSSQANYNYGQPQGPDYGQPTPYSQGAPPSQIYGHGYNEAKYENQPVLHPYGHGGSHYPQGGGMHSGYGAQEQYGKPPSYDVPPQGSHLQSYGQPRPTQPTDIPYQVPISSTQSYGPNVPPQQPYPYASSGQMQQTYPSYGSAPAADGYSHPPTASASAAGYPQQASQPVYSQSGGQQAPGYGQMGHSGGYGGYPGYTEQAAPNNAGYGYQGPADPAYGGSSGAAYGAPLVGQPGYVQPASTQPVYNQSIPQ